MVLGKFTVLGVLLIWIIVQQGPIALEEGAGGFKMLSARAV